MHYRRPFVRILRSCFLLFALLSPSAAVLAAEAQLPLSPTAGWPQFRGPARDGVSRETGLLGEWPEAGPPLSWKIGGLGLGYSSPAIADGTIFIAGDVDRECAIFAFDLDGRMKWKTVNGAFWEKPYPGSRATITVDDDRLFHMNAHGRVACMDAATGAEIWAVDILERFQAENIRWGMSECLSIDGDRVIVAPGGPQTLLAALDKRTGETVWTSGPLRFTRTVEMGGIPVDEPYEDCDNAGYASPMLFELGGKRLIAGASARHLYCADADSGAILWTHPVEARFEVIGTIPAFWRDCVLFTAPDAFGARLFRVSVEANAVSLDQVWESPVDNCHGALVRVGDRFYGAGYRRFADWVCLDAATGEMLYSKSDLIKGSCIWADERLYALAEDGTIELLEPGGDGFRVKGRMALLEKKKKDFWAHPVIQDGFLYLRYHDDMWRFDIRSAHAE
ncbi:MAG: outer membrane biogenesis protein BamB [candidate division BRC1 bacterium ADurb.BinA364]|nr:MAG: outer membrane biogenesis protein BamB [candidate division BRC1 bacterium ADurb.BinA364]